MSNFLFSLKQGIIGALIGAIITFPIVYFLIPMPVTTFDNAMGGTISALINGFFAAFVGFLVYLNKKK